MTQLSTAEDTIFPEQDARRREELLVELAKRGEASAFVELVELHRPRLFRKVHQITGNWQDAEDALQSAQMNAFIHIHSFDGRSMYSTWMMRVAVNSALGVLRKKRTRREISLECDLNEDDGLPSLDIPDTRYCPEMLYKDSESANLLHNAIGRLRPSLRAVIELYYAEHLTAKEIAARLDISAAAAKSRLSRAKAILRRRLLRSRKYDLLLL